MPGHLAQIRAEGAPAEIGLRLGLAGREATMRFLLPHPLWQRVNAPEHAAAVQRMAKATEDRFPWIWAEIEGMAQGLGLPVDQVMAWNCRGDLLASVPDGCTTVMDPGPPIRLAHNEDGFPFLRGHCLLADLRPARHPALTSFAYPASIPGHSFAVTNAGLVQTVNNIRLTGLHPEIPRMVLGRAVLACTTLDQAVGMLQKGTGSGGFHFALARAGEPRLLSVEFGKAGLSVVALETRQAHANHALHLPQGLAGQTVTQSSADRQARAEVLVANGADPLAILADQSGAGLPIRREEHDDPDTENTLATLGATVGAGGVDWQIFDAPGQPATYSGEVRV